MKINQTKVKYIVSSDVNIIRKTEIKKKNQQINNDITSLML